MSKLGDSIRHYIPPTGSIARLLSVVYIISVLVVLHIMAIKFGTSHSNHSPGDRAFLTDAALSILPMIFLLPSAYSMWG